MADPNPELGGVSFLTWLKNIIIYEMRYQVLVFLFFLFNSLFINLQKL